MALVPHQTASMIKVAERYQLIEEVGRGGMATVYRGLDTNLNREVAVKVLHPHLADEAESRQRFQREAVAVARLHHPNILEIFDYSGHDSPSSYIVTEFIRGRTLKEHVTRTPVPLPEIAALIVVEICMALGHAHGVGIIHRDVKPENIMIRSDGVLKLMDFGIAQVVDVQRLTVTGQLLGSPAYMAPEQVEGRPLDFRTDVFAVGTLLYQLATNQLPFSGRNPHEVLKRIGTGTFADPEMVNPQVPAQLGAIIRKALSRRPEDRYQTIAEFQVALIGFVEEADVTAVRDELRRFFENPGTASEDMRGRVIASLVRKGKEQLVAGRAAKAIALLNRVLCHDPKHGEVQALLDRMAARRRWGKTAGALSALALVLSVGFLGVRALSWRDPGAEREPEREPEPVAPQAPAPAPAKKPPAKATRPPASADAPPTAPDPATTLRPATPRHRPTPEPTPDGPIREMPLFVTPKSGTVELNGSNLGEFVTVPKVPLRPGLNRLVLRNEACKDLEIEIDSADPREAIRARLEWKDATVLVHVNNQAGAEVAAEISINGNVGTAGRWMTVPFPRQALGRVQGLRAVVSAPGYQDQTVVLELEAGRGREPWVTLREAP